jgi:hypothetical protein
MLIRLILSKTYKDCCGKLQDANATFTKVVDNKLEEVFGRLAGSMKAQDESWKDFENKVRNDMKGLLKMYVSILQSPNPFTEMQQ